MPRCKAPASLSPAVQAGNPESGVTFLGTDDSRIDFQMAVDYDNLESFVRRAKLLPLLRLPALSASEMISFASLFFVAQLYHEVGNQVSLIRRYNPFLKQDSLNHPQGIC